VIRDRRHNYALPASPPSVRFLLALVPRFSLHQILFFSFPVTCACGGKVNVCETNIWAECEAKISGTGGKKIEVREREGAMGG
jgi:hypothetical protein